MGIKVGIGNNGRKLSMRKDGAPGGIRTPNPQIRSLMLCPVELRAPLIVRTSQSKLIPNLFQKRTDAAMVGSDGR